LSDIFERLGVPAIHSNPARHGQGILVFGVMCLADDDPPRIAAGVRHTLHP
jgi:hypothetical protein